MHAVAPEPGGQLQGEELKWHSVAAAVRHTVCIAAPQELPQMSLSVLHNPLFGKIMLLSIGSEETSRESANVSPLKPMAEFAIANLPLPHSALVFPDTLHYWVDGTPLGVEHPVEAEVPSPLPARG